MSSASHSDNSTTNDVLLYAQSRLTRKQAVRQIGEIVLKANMKPRTVKHALELIKAILPPDNTLPSTVQELFGAMLSSENDWRLAQYLIRHKQQPSFSSSSDNSTSFSQFTALTNSSSSSSSSSSEDESDTESEDETDDEDEDENHLLFALRQAQRPLQPALVPPGTMREETEERRPSSILATEQRSQIVSNPFNRFGFLGSFKRQLSESSSSSDENLDCDLHISDGESDEESFDFLNTNPQSNPSNTKSCCFEFNGQDLLDEGAKRRRH